MRRELDIHPCFTCSLSDCDDGNSRCALRRVLSRESSLRKSGKEVSATLKLQRSIAYHEIYGITRNEKRRTGMAS